MKKLILSTKLFLCVAIAFAQEYNETSRPLNNVYVNLYGDASLISINYERLYFVSSKVFLAGKLGLGSNEESDLTSSVAPEEAESFTTIPHHFTANFGRKRSSLEFGLGGTIITGKIPNHYFMYSIIGYRLHPLKSKKMNFRIYGQIPISKFEWAGFFPNPGFYYSPIGLSAGISL